MSIETEWIKLRAPDGGEQMVEAKQPCLPHLAIRVVRSARLYSVGARACLEIH